jgi:hypothetical protein
VPATADSGREYRRRGPNLRLLEQVARLTGGAVNPEPAAVLSARPGVTRERMPLAPILVPIILALLLVDIALRRWRDPARAELRARL